MSDEVQLTKYQEAVLSEIISTVGDPAATLDTIGGHLGQIWEDANNRGDEQALQLINTSWEYVQLMSQQQGHAMNLAAAARELAEIAQGQLAKAQEEIEEVRNEYDDLVTAIDMGSEAHELLADYAAEIREDAQNQAQAWMEEDALDYAFQNVDETVSEAIGDFCHTRKIADLGYNAKSSLVEKMRGETEWDPRQAALFAQIIEIERQLQEKRDQEREAQYAKWKVEAAKTLEDLAKGQAAS
jgi:hypothetical protein